MYNALESLDLMLEVSMPWAVLLSVLKGVPFLGCGCPSSIHEMRTGQLCLAPRYNMPVSASDAEETTFLIVWKIMLTALLILYLYFHPRH